MKKDWEIKKLGELTLDKMSYGTSSPSCEYDGETRYIRITDINDKGELNEDFVSPISYEEKHVLQDGDIVFARTGATVGKAYCYNSSDEKYVYAGYLIRLRPNRKIVLPDYIFYYTKSKNYLDFISASQVAAAQPNVNAEKYSNLEIPLPPLEEQKRIVKILDEKFAQLETIKANAQTNLQNAKDLFQSQLTKAFSNTTWEKKRLGDCGSFKNGMNFAATDSGYTIRSLGVGDFKDRYSIDNTETLSEISLKAAPSEDYLLHDGDIVFVRSNGNKELVGRCLLVYPKDIPTTYSGFCIRFRKDFDLLDADFLLHFMKAESSRKILNGKEGANISNLNQKILGDFEVPLPPLPEQKRIVKDLDALSEKVKALQNIYEQMLLDCEELKQSFLCKAFAGEL